jgi:hypothetical protein
LVFKALHYLQLTVFSDAIFPPEPIPPSQAVFPLWHEFEHCTGPSPMFAQAAGNVWKFSLLFSVLPSLIPPTSNPNLTLSHHSWTVLSSMYFRFTFHFGVATFQVLS